MNHNSILKFGGNCSIFAGVLYLLVGISHFLLPRAQLRGAAGVNSKFFISLAENSLIFIVHYWIVVLLSFMIIAVIVAFYELLRENRTGAFIWLSIIGVGGAMLSMIDFAYIGVEAPRIARRFIEVSPEVQSVMILIGLPHIDPCFMASGLMGLWALMANYKAWRKGLIPAGLGYIGLVGGFLCEVTFLGSLIRIPLLVDIGVGLGGLIIGPVWHIWAGITLRGKTKINPSEI